MRAKCLCTYAKTNLTIKLFIRQQLARHYEEAAVYHRAVSALLRLRRCSACMEDAEDQGREARLQVVVAEVLVSAGLFAALATGGAAIGLVRLLHDGVHDLLCSTQCTTTVGTAHTEVNAREHVKKRARR